MVLRRSLFGVFLFGRYLCNLFLWSISIVLWFVIISPIGICLSIFCRLRGTSISRRFIILGLLLWFGILFREFWILHRWLLRELGIYFSRISFLDYPSRQMGFGVWVLCFLLLWFVSTFLTLLFLWYL